MLLTLLLTTFGLSCAWADTADEADTAESTAEKQPKVAEQVSTEDEAKPEPDNGDGIKSPKTMSGMSILGNEEAPKSLVIIPWKSSRMGDELGLSDTLDDRAQPVDKEVFLRELQFYKIRAGEET
jgi:hypothetical protein